MAGIGNFTDHAHFAILVVSRYRAGIEPVVDMQDNVGIVFPSQYSAQIDRHRHTRCHIVLKTKKPDLLVVDIDRRPQR